MEAAFPMPRPWWSGRKGSRAGEIDPLADLSKDRVYLFSGGKDRVVDRQWLRRRNVFTSRLGFLRKTSP